MKRLFDYLRLVLFVGGVLIGVQVPAFVDQYGKRLDAHWEESQRSLQSFQADADKFFDGSIQRLIQHYRSSDDPVVNDGGVSLKTLFDRNAMLSQAHAQFNQGIFDAYYQTLLNPIGEIRNKTWSEYNFTIVLDAAAIVWGLAVGLLASLTVELLLLLLGLLLVRPFSSRPRARRPVRRHL